MSYAKALNTLNTLHPLGIRPGLERIRALLKALGNPERGMKVIHVAGTNGKGSVCRILESALVESGYKTGAFISPHLVDFRERFRIDGKSADAADIAAEWPKLQRALAKPEVQLHGPATFFEAVTGLAFLVFKRRGCEALVLETGLGGRFDSTNVIAKPLLTVITNISLEHTQILGKTAEKIAWEKAGILKKGSPLVTAAEGKALGVIKKVFASVRGKGLTVLVSGKNWKIHKVSQALLPKAGQDLDIEVLSRRRSLRLPLLGPYQRVNLACALAGIETLRGTGLQVPEDALARGVAKAVWPGRMQVVSQKPVVLLDGAHNPAGARALAAAVRSLKPRRVLLVAGVLKDKDWKSMFRVFATMTKDFYLARPRDERGLEPEPIIRHLGRGKAFASPTSAYLAAKKAAKSGDLVVVAGSLYLIGEILKRVDLDRPAL
ncbi:MAG: folylpolyglutamate synthase/dihydrofolate synthase family protein [candidate division FCPU426 bacterium]